MERRAPSLTRPSFATLARAAIEKHVPESRGSEAWWSLANNAVWVRWPLESIGFAYLGLHRHLQWLSGEVGISRESTSLGELFQLPGSAVMPVPGYRIRLGHLIEGEDRWWPVGPNQHSFIEQLEWLALQLRVKGASYFRRYPEPDPSPSATPGPTSPIL